MMAQEMLIHGGRGLLALLFILAGIAKAVGPRPFLDHMAECGVPGVLLPGVIVLEIGAGLAVLLGYRLGYSATALGVFCMLAAVVFHRRVSDKAERTLFLKDLALGGALISVGAAAGFV